MQKKILVVDNHPLILKFMTGLLEKKGHIVLTAPDGLAALEVLKEFTPDVIFVDLVMPHISGDKLCSIIREMPGLRDAYIVILSALAAEEAENFTDFGADACIAKGPFNEMSKHVLDAIDESDRKGPASLQWKVKGRGDIYQREITKELLVSKRYTELILNNLSEGILELAPGGKVIYANPAAVKLLDISETKLLASDFAEIFQGDDRKRLKEMIGTSRPPVKKNNSPFKLNSMLVSVNIITVKENERNYLIVILENVTEKMRLEEERMKTKKLESFGVIAAGVAHDFNNLLTVILGNINLAQMKITPGDSVAAPLGEAEKASLQAKDLTEKFITFSTGDVPDKKPSSVRELFDDCLAGILDNSSVACRCFLPDELWMVCIDKDQMKQAFCNILQNAEEAMPGGGIIEITADNATFDSVQRDTGLPISSESYVRICIQDQGVGIPGENIEKIFDPYFSTKDRCTQKGLGLGLVITHSIIQRHGGHIRVESKVGEGTRFYIYLPAYKDDSCA